MRRVGKSKRSLAGRLTERRTAPNAAVEHENPGYENTARYQSGVDPARMCDCMGEKRHLLPAEDPTADASGKMPRCSPAGHSSDVYF